MRFKPLRDLILVRPVPVETKSAGGILIPDQAQERPQEGEILAVGPGAVSAQVGDTVFYGKYHGKRKPLTIDGVDCCLIHEDEILAILDE